jgi:glycerol-3-phosphate acyltransferase PlsY
MNIVFEALLLCGAYLLGSFPSAYYVAKRAQGLDIRKVGSGNVGSTNAVRLMGLPLGLLVFVADVLKGYIPAILGLWLGGETLAILAGLASLIGHAFPVWLSFQGGKGVATALGVALALFPLLGLLGFVTWGIALALTNCVAAGSVAAAAALGAMVLATEQPLSYKLVFALIVLFVIWRHRINFVALKK